MNIFTGRGAKFYEFCVKLNELMWLNLLVVLTSLPIFTIGASFTAMHTVLVKIYRDEEDKITKEFFAAFKSNFKQATLIWLIYMGIFTVLILDYGAFENLNDPSLRYLSILVPVLGFITILSLCWAFVLQSRYKLSIKDIFVFSFTRIIAFPLRTLLMAATLIVPFLIAWYMPGLLIVVFIFGISVPGILGTCFYNYALKVMEDDSDRQPEEQTEAEAENDEAAEETDGQECDETLEAETEENTVADEETADDGNE